MFRYRSRETPGDARYWKLKMVANHCFVTIEDTHFQWSAERLTSEDRVP